MKRVLCFPCVDGHFILDCCRVFIPQQTFWKRSWMNWMFHISLRLSGQVAQLTAWSACFDSQPKGPSLFLNNAGPLISRQKRVWKMNGSCVQEPGQRFINEQTEKIRHGKTEGRQLSRTRGEWLNTNVKGWTGIDEGRQEMKRRKIKPKSKDHPS